MISSRTILCAAFVFHCFVFKHKVIAFDRPNIIVFVTDDQNREDLACYGGNVLTPNVDRLAQEGMRFDNAHVPSTVCTPSRYTLLTGRFPGNSYFKPYLDEYPRNVMGRPAFNVGLEADNMNIGDVLRESGYVTGLVGKLHVGPHLKDPEDFARYGLNDVSKKNGVMNPDDPAVIAGWQRNEKWFRQWIMDRGFSWAKHVYWGNVHGAYPRHNPEWTLEAALEFIETNKSKPFYLPCIMRWPKEIKPGSVSSSLVQTTDFVPTFLDIGGVAKPADYRLDGTSLRPLFTDSEYAVHDHLYFELGNARAVRTRDWKYLAIRYDAEQFRRIQSADLLRLPRALAYIGNDKNLSNHLGRRSHFLESDQLYHLATDPMETNNLARSPKHARQLDKLKSILAAELELQARPFGEFVPGRDMVPVKKVEPFVKKLASLKVIKRGFEVIDADIPEGPTESLTREERKKQREERKKHRQTRK